MNPSLESPLHTKITRLAALILMTVLSLACKAFAASDHSLSPHDRKLYEDAFTAADRGQWDIARTVSRQAKNDSLQDVLLWKKLQDKSIGSTTFAEVVSFIETHPDWPHLSPLRQRAEALATGNEPEKSLIDWFDKSPPASGHGKWIFARTLFLTGQQKRAISLIQEAWRSSVFSKADENDLLALFGQFLSPSDHIKRLDTLLWDRQTASAKRMLSMVPETEKNVVLARLALIEDQNNKTSLIKNVPPSHLETPGLVYERVRWRRLQDMKDQAIDLLKTVSSGTGNPDKWWKEREALARYCLEEGRFSVAYDLVKDHGLESGSAFADAEWMAGWIALRFLNKPEKAKNHFLHLRAGVRSPISTARADYWTARAAEALGQQEEADRYYAAAAHETTTYYGQLAAETAGLPLKLPPAPQISAEDRDALEKNVLITLSRSLALIGRPKDARPFLIHALDIAKTPGTAALVAQTASNIGQPDLAVALSRRAALQGIILVETGYPIPEWSYPSYPEKALLLAITRQESNFLPDAISSAGAKGAMQLMPATARLIAQKENIPHSEDALTTSPDHNIRLGSAYLGELLEKFNGNYPLAIAGYNAGPGRPLSWIRRFGDPRDIHLDTIDWIEMIPFPETRNYVQRVLESLQVYRHRLGNTDTASSLGQDLFPPP